MRKVAISLLTKLDCKVSSASNGEEALAMFSPEWDLIFMDCQMPVLNGLEATQRWRALEQAGNPTTHIPIVALTGETDEADRVRCLDAGMDDFVSKPLKIDILKAVLQKWASVIDHDATTYVYPGSTVQHAPVLDELLVEYKGFESLLAQLIRTYRFEWPDLIACMQNAIRDSDTLSLYQLAHKLKGQTLTLHVAGLANIAQRIEAQAKLGELNDIYSEVDSLENELHGSLLWLENIASRIDISITD